MIKRIPVSLGYTIGLQKLANIKQEISEASLDSSLKRWLYQLKRKSGKYKLEVNDHIYCN